VNRYKPANILAVLGDERMLEFLLFPMQFEPARGQLWKKDVPPFNGFHCGKFLIVKYEEKSSEAQVGQQAYPGSNGEARTLAPRIHINCHVGTYQPVRFTQSILTAAFV
jgi:hypothetical protein